MTSVKINRLWHMATSKMHIKYEIEIPNRVTLLKPCHRQSPANMAARRPFCKWHYWKSTGFFPYTQVMSRWSLNLIFKAKIKLESGNRKIQHGCQVAILKVTSLKINRLLPTDTNTRIWNFKLKFQSKFELRSGNHVVYRRQLHWVGVWISNFCMFVPIRLVQICQNHYNDVIMNAMASQITSLAIVYSTVYSGADQRKHKSSKSLAFVRGIHRWPVNSPRNGPVKRKMVPFDDVIMFKWFLPRTTSSCIYRYFERDLHYAGSRLASIHWPKTSWWLQILRGQIGANSSTNTMLTLSRLGCHINHVISRNSHQINYVRERSGIQQPAAFFIAGGFVVS